jgi:hypothetical protein
MHTQDQFPDVNKIKLAIIGVLDNEDNLLKLKNVSLIFLRKNLQLPLATGKRQLLI